MGEQQLFRFYTSKNTNNDFLFQWKLIISGQEKGGRKVPGNYYVTGGVHLTANSYPVTTYLKQLTATESSGMELPLKYTAK